MAGTTFSRARLADVNALGTRLVFGTADKKDARITPGELREMANGEMRAVSRVTNQGTLDVTAVMINRADLSTLDQWRGRLLLYRDTWGRVFYGTYWSINVKNYPSGQNLFDVSFSLQRISYDPNVAGAGFPV